MLDLELGTLDTLCICFKEQLCRQDNPISNQDETVNNWVKGYCTEGIELIDSTLFNYYKEAQDCDCAKGFQITIFVGDVIESGSGTSPFPKIRKEFQDRSSKTIYALLSPKGSNTVVEIYNSTLSFHLLVDLIQPRISPIKPFIPPTSEP